MRRYVPLLVALFGVLSLQAILASLSEGNIPLNFAIYLLLPTAIYAVGPRRSLLAVAGALAVATL
jgi:hypothetical protein